MKDQNSGLKSSHSEYIGILYGASSFIAWGLFPLYWKLLKNVPAIEILAHRILWSFVFVGVLVLALHKWSNVKGALKEKRNLFYIFLCSILVSFNWFTYIWAVNSNHIIESSMGYYINPLMSVLLGMLVLKEKLNPCQYVALGFATVGVAIITVQYGQIPWISLTLAVTFALYGLFKKLVVTDSLSGLLLETAFPLPVVLVFLTGRQIRGTAAFGLVSITETMLLLGAGIVTATPLIWFSNGAKRISLSTLGFLQYISPTISLILGVFVFGEKFSKEHIISFGFIWIALVIFSFAKTDFAAKIIAVSLKGSE